MNSHSKIVSIATAVVLMAICQAALALETENDRVQAKIGILIKNSETTRQAKSRETIKVGSELRIYVHPEKSSYVYVVHTDGDSVQLLNMTRQKIHSTTMVLPSVQSWYRIDGNSDLEKFVVICSPTVLPELAAMESKDVSYDEWTRTEAKLAEKSKTIFAEEQRPVFELAGTVRGLDISQDPEAMIDAMRAFSGREILVNTYAFEIEK